MRKVFFAFALVLFVAISTIPAFAQPVPGVPQVRQVNMYPRAFSSVTATVGELFPVYIDVILSTGQHVFDLNRAPVAFRSDGGSKNEFFCAKEQGVCVVRGLELGTVQFTITTPDGIWGYAWVNINFIRPTNLPVDKLAITFSTNEVITGETVTAAVTFPKSFEGAHILQVSNNGNYQYFYYPDGIKQGERQVVLERRNSPLQDAQFGILAELRKVPGDIIVARNWGRLDRYKGFDIKLDKQSETLTITDPNGSRDLEYRVFITQGEKFLLELPIRKFDLARGAELVFFDGMYGSDLTLAIGRYTVTVNVFDKKSGNENNRTETNALVITDTLRWH